MDVSATRITLPDAWSTSSSLAEAIQVVLLLQASPDPPARPHPSLTRMRSSSASKVPDEDASSTIFDMLFSKSTSHRSRAVSASRVPVSPPITGHTASLHQDSHPPPMQLGNVGLRRSRTTDETMSGFAVAVTSALQEDIQQRFAVASQRLAAIQRVKSDVAARRDAAALRVTAARAAVAAMQAHIATLTDRIAALTEAVEGFEIASKSRATDAHRTLPGESLVIASHPMLVDLLDAVAEDCAVGDFFDLNSSGDMRVPISVGGCVRDNMALARRQLNKRWRARRLAMYLHANFARGEPPLPPLGALAVGAAPPVTPVVAGSTASPSYAASAAVAAAGMQSLAAARAQAAEAARAAGPGAHPAMQR